MSVLESTPVICWEAGYNINTSLSQRDTQSLTFPPMGNLESCFWMVWGSRTHEFISGLLRIIDIYKTVLMYSCIVGYSQIKFQMFEIEIQAQHSLHFLIVNKFQENIKQQWISLIGKRSFFPYELLSECIQINQSATQFHMLLQHRDILLCTHHPAATNSLP